MATNIFGGLTAAVLALSIWMGFKNNDEFKNQQNLNERAAIQLKAGQEDLTNLTAKRDETVTSKEATLAENVQESEKLEKVITEVAAIEADITSQKSIVSSNESKIASNNDILKGLPDPDILVPQITATKNNIAQLKSDIESDEANLENLKQREESTRTLAANKRNVIEHQTAGKSLPSLSTTVQSVYRNWGFVTLNGGNAHGVVPGSVLDVLRNGEVVAKLKVTAVEQNRAAADIIPDALPVIVALRSGDRVVAEKIAQQ
ncbi:MAG: hypothetical protein ABGY95_00535 [Rubritalea sp.]|uniref:hypothetical protein n=1 Tax=Rubritalea sp. TaxID=2109375 RepID=UPI003241E45D